MKKRCVSCGMPLEKTADFPLGDCSKDYCVYCAQPDGSLKSYAEALAGMTQFIMQSQGFAESAARDVAKAAMAKQPAWQITENK